VYSSSQEVAHTILPKEASTQIAQKEQKQTTREECKCVNFKTDTQILFHLQNPTVMPIQAKKLQRTFLLHRVMLLRVELTVLLRARHHTEARRVIVLVEEWKERKKRNASLWSLLVWKILLPSKAL
jgi:hypothetical protein